MSRKDPSQKFTIFVLIGLLVVMTLSVLSLFTVIENYSRDKLMENGEMEVYTPTQFVE